MMAGLRAAGRGITRLIGRGAKAVSRTGARTISRAGTETEVIAGPKGGRIPGRGRVEVAAKFPERGRVGSEIEGNSKTSTKKGGISSKVGPALTGASLGLMAADLLGGEGQHGQPSAYGGDIAGATRTQGMDMATAAVQSQKLHDKTVLKLARLEARTRLSELKIQRNRDIICSYLQNPVVGFALAYATAQGVYSAMKFAEHYGDVKIANTVQDMSKTGLPSFSIPGTLTSISGTQLQPMTSNPMPDWAKGLFKAVDIASLGTMSAVLPKAYEGI